MTVRELGKISVLINDYTQTDRHLTRIMPRRLEECIKFKNAPKSLKHRGKKQGLCKAIFLKV